MNIKDIKARCKLVTDAGGLVEKYDYGWTTVAILGSRKFYISKELRTDREGYEGYKLISLDILQIEIDKFGEKLKENLIK